jgi:hypothetical protein
MMLLLALMMRISGALPVWVEFMVVPTKVYDSLVDGTDNLEVDAVAISGDGTSADNLELDYDGTGYAKANSTIGTATDVTNQVTADVTAVSGDSGAADNLELDYDGTGYNKANSTIGTAAALTANNDKTGYSISGTKQTLDALNDVSTAEVNTEVDTALSDIGLDHLISASVAGADITDNSIIAQMVSKSATADWDSFDNTTDALEAIADTSAPSAAVIADAVWDEARSGHVAGGSFGEGVGLLSKAM